MMLLSLNTLYFALESVWIWLFVNVGMCLHASTRLESCLSAHRRDRLRRASLSDLQNNNRPQFSKYVEAKTENCQLKEEVSYAR